MQKSSPEIINDGKWIFSKLINARAEASRWFNDCLLGINYNKNVKIPDYTYFYYPSAEILLNYQIFSEEDWAQYISIVCIYIIVL